MRSVETLVNAMLRPIEERLRWIEGKVMRFDSPMDAAEWLEWRCRNSLAGDDHIIKFGELKRLRRIESAAQELLNCLEHSSLHDVWTSEDELRKALK